MSRIAAAHALSNKAGREEITALGEALSKDPFWGVQREIARALGKVHTPLALKLLTEKGLSLPHPKARRAVVEALGGFRDDAGARSLARVLDGDPSYFVEGEAAFSLGKTKASFAFDELAKSSEKNSWNEVIRGGVFRGLSSLEDDRALSLLSGYARYGAPEQARYPAIRALGKLGGAKAELPPEILDLLSQLADETNFRTAMAVVDALEETQSPKALPVLERMQVKAVDGRLKTRIDEAKDSIRSGRKQLDEIHQIRDDLENLREENRRLKDRLDQWSAASDAKTHPLKNP
jgi:aminopeptidase N